MSAHSEEEPGTLRAVFDTNVLIDSAVDPFSAPARLLQAVREGRITALATAETVREYRKIIKKMVPREEDREELEELISTCRIVRPERVEIELDDSDDMKFLQAAAGGQADILVTNDRHLLDVGEYGDVRIMRPTEAMALVEEGLEDNNEWTGWVKGLGIG